MSHSIKRQSGSESFIQELADGNDRSATFLMASVFLLCLATPLLFIPFGWLIFFGLIMPFDDLMYLDPPNSRLVFTSEVVGTLVNFLFWTILSSVFGVVFRKRRLRVAIPYAYLLIVVVVVSIHLLAERLGFAFQGIFGRVS